MADKGDDRLMSTEEPPMKRAKTARHTSSERHDADPENATEDMSLLRDSHGKTGSHQQGDSSRRESVLVMRLATKEQEIQELLPQIHELKASQLPSAQQLRSALLDPAVNLLFQRLTTELNETKEKLSQAQDDMSAWQFTPDSVTGRKLMAKCRSLLQENQELGKQLSQGRIAQLEAELALQKKYGQELKSSQDEMQTFILQLDEELEGMQSTIMKLQDQLRQTKQQLAEAQERAKERTRLEEEDQRQPVASAGATEQSSYPGSPRPAGATANGLHNTRADDAALCADDNAFETSCRTVDHSACSDGVGASGSEGGGGSNEEEDSNEDGDDEEEEEEENSNYSDTAASDVVSKAGEDASDDDACQAEPDEDMDADSVGQESTES